MCFEKAGWAGGPGGKWEGSGDGWGVFLAAGGGKPGMAGWEASRDGSRGLAKDAGDTPGQAELISVGAEEWGRFPRLGCGHQDLGQGSQGITCDGL